MDFSYAPREEAFRKEVREWLAENMRELPAWWNRTDIPGPEADSDEYHQFGIWWHRKLHDAGFVGIAWPKQYGGRGLTIIEEIVFNEEIARYRAPSPTNIMGTSWVGPSIMRHGTEEQKRRFLPRILSCEDWWCTLYSEPEAGSDMANVKTRAIEDGDDFVVNGQKVWTSGGYRADWGVLLARTDPNVPKHRGLSYLLVNMHSPGITLRPLVQITGHAGFNETFFDNVRVPSHQILGEKNKGWYVAMGGLEGERTVVTFSITRDHAIRDLITLARELKRNGQPLSRDLAVRQKLAQFYIDTSVAKYMELRVLTRLLRGLPLGAAGSITHIFEEEFGQRLQEFAMQMEGPYSQLLRGSRRAIQLGRWQNSFLQSRGLTIAGGTVEINRNIIAERGLGLPRGR